MQNYRGLTEKWRILAATPWIKSNARSCRHYHHLNRNYKYLVAINRLSTRGNYVKCYFTFYQMPPYRSSLSPWFCVLNLRRIAKKLCNTLEEINWHKSLGLGVINLTALVNILSLGGWADIYHCTTGNKRDSVLFWSVFITNN